MAIYCGGSKTVGIINQIKIDEKGCWNWQGYKIPTGYGKVRFMGKSQLAHRVMAHCFLRFNLRSKQYVLHRCDNPACINPKHLFIGDQFKNLRDCVAKGRNFNTKKTHCPHGHEYTKINTWLSKNNARNCKTCWRHRHEH